MTLVYSLLSPPGTTRLQGYKWSTVSLGDKNTQPSVMEKFNRGEEDGRDLVRHPTGIPAQYAAVLPLVC